MTKQVQLRRGTTAEHSVFIGAEGELTIDTTLDIAIVHDGVKVGGHPLVGAASTQQIINKTGVGIGTSSLNSEFELVGDANIEGQISARGLTVRYQEPVERSGIVSSVSNNLISGIATNNIRVGYSVTGTYVSTGSTVVDIGIGTIYLSQNTDDTSILETGKFLNTNGSIVVGIQTLAIEVGYAVSATGVLSNTTVIGISSDFDGSITLSQNTSGTLGITTRTGIVTEFGSSIITGISTLNLLIGDNVENEYVNSNIVAIGSSIVELSVGIGTSGSSSFTFSRTVDFVFSNTSIAITGITFTDPFMGQINVDDLIANKVAISTLTVSQPVADINITNSTTDIAGISSATITDAYISNQVVATQNVTTQEVITSRVATGIITDAGITTASIDTAYIRQGITTSIVTADIDVTGIATVSNLFVENTTSSGVLTALSINVDDLIANTGIITEIGVSTLRSNELYFNVGIGTTSNIENSLTNISYTNVGINTYLSVSGLATVGNDVSLGKGKPYDVTIATGTISTTSTLITGIDTTGIKLNQFVVGPFIQPSTFVISIGSSQVELSFVNTSTNLITTSFTFESRSTIDLDVNGDVRIAGILTVGNSITVNGPDSVITGISTLSLDRLNVINNIVANDQLSYNYQGTLSTASTTIISGVSTEGLEPLFTVSGIDIVENSYILSIGSSTVTLNTPALNVGSSTTTFTFTDGRTGINTIPVLTGRNLNYSGISTLNQTIINSGNISSITASRLDMSNSGIATVDALNVNVGVITNLSGTNLNYSGISTLSNVTIGDSTDLLVDGNARITGVLTIGQSSVTINGNTSSVQGVSTIYANSGVVTSIVGSESSYENVSVGSTLTFVGVNSFTELDNSVSFKLSPVGIATNYTLTLPPNRGRDGMTLTVDAFGNLGFSTNPGGLYENRIYVSSVNGNDTDDGKTKPVQSIKRAAQLASFESFVLPENRFLDAANLLNSNKSFIQTEVVGFITATYPSITSNPDWDRSICARDVGYIVDALVYDLTYNGNSQSVGAGISYYIGVGSTETYVDGEKVETIAGFQYIYEMSKFIINNIEITTDNLGIYQISVGAGQTVFQSFDNTLLYDEQCNPVGYSSACCANVQSTIVNLVGIVTTIIGVGTEAAPEIVLPTSKSNPVAIIVEAGEYVEDNPIILYEDVAVLGDNLRNTIIRPANAGKDLFRVRNGCYLTGFAMKDFVDPAGVPQYTFDYAVAFDDPLDITTDRTGYAIKTNKTLITRSPYIQNCSLLSFLGGNGMKVDGSKVASPNTSIIPEESENPVEGPQPEFGKSMVANAFTMVSFGGIGWRVFNDGYSQVVSCFQIFCKYGSLAQSGGYLSITNSATNFGKYALRSTGFNKTSYAFDRGRISSTGTSGGLATLKVVGLGRSDQDLYILRFFDDTLTDRTVNFKPLVTTVEIDGSVGVDVNNNTIISIGHPFINGDSIIYFGDDAAIPPRIIGGLIPDNQYWIGYVDANTFNLYEDDSLTTIVDLTSTSVGIHTFQKNVQEFFARDVLEAHNVYQRIGIASTSSTINFVSGRQITQTVVGGTAVGIAYTYDSSTRELIVSIEPFDGIRRNFQVTNGTTNLNISDHNSSPVSIAVTSVTGLTTYWTTNFTVDSTDSGTTITGISQLPENFRLHFHRPSIINSSSHTWEFSGSGTDYNALPQNGGKTDVTTEQVSELGGRVYTSGTNELGDFKIGTFITAFNRTGNIIFNNTVTIGTLDSIRLSLSGGTAITEFSSDIQLGDNELGGPLHSRVSTQLAVRSFLNNRLGPFIDKNISTNAVPGAVVQLNAIGQINADLIPPKVTNFYRAQDDGGRTQLVNYIPATDLNSGDTVVEPTNAYVLINDIIGQYLVLDNSTIYDFRNGDEVLGTVSQGGAIGIVTAPPRSGINTTILSFPNVGYGTTGLVRGVPLSLKELSGGSGYTNAGIYTGVRLDTASGIGTGITGTITVSIAGTVSQVAINTGGYKFQPDDILTLNNPSEIGGRVGGSNFTVKVSSVETRLYLKLTNNQKFLGSFNLPDYIQDRNAVAISTNIGMSTSLTFNPTDINVGGAVDFANDRIVVNSSMFGDGDPVVYSNGGGQSLATLVNGSTYYVKKVGISSIELYTTYALSSKLPLTASGTGTHTLTRSGINTSTDQIVFQNHGYNFGDPVRVSIGTESTVLPIGISTGAFYFVGSVTINSFTLHNTRTDSLLSTNGLLFNTINIESTGSGIVSFTKQNVTYISSVNTSSSDFDNWALLASNDIDANNIISGTVSPSRLANGVANNETFLRGDSSWQKVVSSLGIGVTEPIAVTFTSADLAPGGVGVNTYYGNLKLSLNRVQSTLDAYSTLGISKFKNSTFSIGSDGEIQIKNAAGGGDVDAVTLSGNNAAYYLDVTNHTGNIPITRGGTGLSALPSNGAFLVGNGSSYQLTTTPTFIGDATFSGGAGAITLSANSDITLTNSTTWSGNVNGKIQYFSNSLYLTYATSIIFRTGSTDMITFSSAGAITASSTIQGTRLISTIATGTAPLTVTSTTQVSNLNVSFLQGYQTATANTINSIVLRDGSGNFSAGTITATTFSGNISGGTISGTTGTFTGQVTSTLANNTATGGGQIYLNGATGNRIDFNANGVAAPAFTTRSAGTKLVLSPAVAASAVDYAFGINTSTLWSSVPTTAQQFLWYGGTTIAATLSGTGNFTAVGTIQGTRLISTIGTGTAPLTVSSTTLVSNLNSQFLNSVSEPTLTASLRANHNISGGGTITVNASYSVLWSARFIVISNGRGTHFSTNGYFDITCPTSGTITGVGGAASVTATAAGITLATWTALYYILPIGSTNGSLAANFRVVSYTSNLVVPSNWVLIAIRNGDNNAVTFNNGITLNANESLVATYQSSANTANTLVRRDGSGNFAAGTITTNSLIFGTQASKATLSYVTNTARTLTVPNVGGNRTFAFIDQLQTFSVTQTFSAANAIDLTATAPVIRFNNTATRTVSIFTDATISGAVKTINFGTGAAAGSTTTINIGSASGTSTTNVNGNMIVTGTVTANSDIRLKDNIKLIENSIEKLQQIRGVSYTRKDLEGNPLQIGVIAQEVESVFPELIVEHNGYKSVSYGNLAAVLIEAIKEQNSVINNLKTEVENLKSRLEEV